MPPHQWNAVVHLESTQAHYLCCHPASYLHPLNLCRGFDQPKVLHKMSNALDVVFAPSFYLSQGLHVVRVQLCMHWFSQVIPNHV